MNEEQSPTNENRKTKTKEELQVIILNQSREIKNLRKQLDDRIEIGNLHTTNSKSSDKNKLEHFTTMKSKGKINDYPVLLDLWTNTSENRDAAQCPILHGIKKNCPAHLGNIFLI